MPTSRCLIRWYNPLSGLTTAQSGSDDRRPALVRTILPDKLTGLTVAQAITAALFARERGGEGQHIRLSMLDTVIHFLWYSDMGGHTFVGDELETETAQSFIDLIYETVDSNISVAAFRRADWVKLANACERSEWKTDERFLTSDGLETYKAERLELTQQALRGRTNAEWLARFDEFDVPCAPVLTRYEMIRNPQVTANALIVECLAGADQRFDVHAVIDGLGGGPGGGHRVSPQAANNEAFCASFQRDLGCRCFSPMTADRPKRFSCFRRLSGRYPPRRKPDGRALSGVEVDHRMPCLSQL